MDADMGAESPRRWRAFRALVEEVTSGGNVRGRLAFVPNGGSLNLVGLNVEIPIDPKNHVPGRHWITEIAIDADGQAHSGSLREALPSPDTVTDQMLDSVYMPRGENFTAPGKNMRVYAVGPTAQDAVRAFCWSLNDTLDEENIIIEDAPDQATPVFQWEARFRIGESRTSMKVAGKYVPGGAVLTWWK